VRCWQVVRQVLRCVSRTWARAGLLPRREDTVTTHEGLLANGLRDKKRALTTLMLLSKEWDTVREAKLMYG
jgi:hypothetical protein